jgi:hypothetical protein
MDGGGFHAGDMAILSAASSGGGSGGGSIGDPHFSKIKLLPLSSVFVFYVVCSVQFGLDRSDKIASCISPLTVIQAIQLPIAAPVCLIARAFNGPGTIRLP